MFSSFEGEYRFLFILHFSWYGTSGGKRNWHWWMLRLAHTAEGTPDNRFTAEVTAGLRNWTELDVGLCQAAWCTATHQRNGQEENSDQTDKRWKNQTCEWIRPVERYLQVTFAKRKNGLFKKAYELSVLCQCEIAIMVFTKSNRLHQYASRTIDHALRRREAHARANEFCTNADMARVSMKNPKSPILRDEIG